jgi:glycosyltransferase involved in cell wall biosynthesis
VRVLPGDSTTVDPRTPHRIERRGVALVAPTKPPVMGPAVSADLLADHLRSEGWRVERVVTRARRPIHLTGRLHLSNISGALRACATFWGMSKDPGIHVVWLSLTQARLGTIRDMSILWMARRRRLPTVVHLLAGNYDRFYAAQPRPVRWLIKRSLVEVSAGIVADFSLRRCLECVLPPDRVRVVANGVEDLPSRPRPHDEGEIQVVYLSTVWIEKGILDLIRAVPDVLRSVDKRVRFTIAGEVFPNDLDLVTRLISRTGMGSSVRFVGTVTGQAKLDLLHSADIFVFPSRLPEAHPLAVLEAMMVGLPIVATDVGDLRSTLPAQADALVPSCRPDELARAILELARDPARRRAEGEANRAKALGEYTAESFGSGVAAVLQQVLRE